MLRLASLVSMLLSFGVTAQYDWTWTELDTMPFRTSNNAVCEASVAGEDFVYSFGGIDFTKSYDGIHQRSFKYTVASNSWEEIAPLPDTLGKIAAGASFVKGKIYILGGYHVFANGNEISSDRVHIYNPTSDSYEADGTSIPRAIDDHVQCVYKDSLIFLVTGWSNTANWPDVQIYDPTLDQWQQGTSVPNNNTFKAFGASGYIIGDTLYYHGGVSGNFAFTARKFMRKGYINPSDPTDITWESMGEAPGEAGYRAACSGVGNTAFWIGGAATAYNYDGIAYDGSGGVEPSTRILHFHNYNYQYVDEVSEPYGIMDFRGIAKLPNNRWIICGGMDSSQVVSNRTFLLENNTVHLGELPNESLTIEYHSDFIRVKSDQKIHWKMLDLSGKIMEIWEVDSQVEIDKGKYSKGIYLVGDKEQYIRIRI